MRFPPPIVVQAHRVRIGQKPCPPLPVGLVPWEPDQARTTVVVKVSYRYNARARDPVLELAAEQPGFALAAPSERQGASAEELAAPTDLVAAKPQADVLLVGSAYAARAVARIDARLSVAGRLERDFCTVGPSPVESMPLAEAFLRDRDGSSRIDAVGPIGPLEVQDDESAEALTALGLDELLAQRHAAMRALADETWKPWEDAGLEAPPPRAEEGAPEDSAAELSLDELGDSGVATWDDLAPAESALGRGVQFAAEPMTCALLDGDELLDLEGLTPGGGSQTLVLPGHLVLVVFEGAGARYDVSMAIDTLLIDTEKARLSLVWRGQIPEDAFALPGLRLIVALAHQQRVPELDEIVRNLARGHFSRAEVPPESEVPPPPPDDVELGVARQMTFDRTPDPLLDLDRYATVAAELACHPNERASVLARAGLDEIDWMLEERGWLARLSAAKEAGDLDFVHDYDRVCAVARRRARAEEG